MKAHKNKEMENSKGEKSDGLKELREMKKGVCEVRKQWQHPGSEGSVAYIWEC